MNEKSGNDDEYPIRVGTAISLGNGKYNYEKYISPKGVEYENIIVLMKSHSKYYHLGPYNLVDEKGRIFENVWQGSKIYPYVPDIIQYQNPYTKDIVSWQHQYEIHIDPDTRLPTEEYWQWREKLMNNKYYVRWPVPKNFTSNCAYSIPECDTNRKLGYILSRKVIYGPLYAKLVRQQELYKVLQQKLENGIRINIIEVDGPRKESIDYYVNTYGVSNKWIQSSSIPATRNNLSIMLHDKKHSFGHGYVLAIALQNMDTIFNRIVAKPVAVSQKLDKLPIIDFSKLKISIISELTKTIIDTGSSQLNLYRLSNRSIILVKMCVEEIEKNNSLIHHPTLGLMGGSEKFQRRSVGFYSNESEGYKYSKQIMVSQPLSQLLQLMLDGVNNLFKSRFNGILVNKYDGKDEYVSYHSDNENDLEPLAGVVAISYGISRNFCVKDYATRTVTKIPTCNEEMIQMAGRFQKEFQHSIPKQACKGIRYSFTFRCHTK